MEDVKSELKQENYEKKQIGHSASKKVGRRKKMSMPFEMMSKEERRKVYGTERSYDLQDGTHDPWGA